MHPAHAFKLVTAPTLRHRYQVVRADGLPDINLTLFANSLRHSLSEASIPLYLREILALINWSADDPVVQAHGWQLLGEPAQSRNIIRQYLCVAAKCKLTTRTDTCGLKVTYVNAAQGSAINIRILLAALKRLFEALSSNGLYPHHNPLVHEDATSVRNQLRQNYRQAVQAIEERAPMPAKSGVDPPAPDLRLSENYFRHINNEWVPRTVDDVDFPNLVYAAGKKYGWSLRELCVTRTLFESGARISEICSLTANDWSFSHFTNRFRASNKGSHGKRTKILVVSSPTAKLYRRYFEGFRDSDKSSSALTIRRLTRLLSDHPEQLADIPLFLTARGAPLTAKLFRDYYWTPALKAAGIDADPHQGRHWFVTNALRNIEQFAKTEADLIRGKQELIQYMAWRTGERTLATYDHIQRAGQFLGKLEVIHKKMKRREMAIVDSPKRIALSQTVAVPQSEALDDDLSFLLGEDEDDDT
jgi:integrase